MRGPWTARRSNEFILKKISSRCLLEEPVLKLKLQSLGHLMRGDPSVISRLRRLPGEKNSDSLQYFCLEKNLTEKPGKLHCVGTTRVRYNLITKSPPRKHRLRLQLLLGYQGRARTQSPATVSYTVGFPLFEGHTRTAMGEPRPGRATFLIMVSPLPGK